MADVSLDAVSGISASTNRAPRTTVWVSASIGYSFYIDNDGTFGYTKTTDGGASWGAQVEVAAATTHTAFDVWHDKWTPGIGTNLIHLAYFDTTNDDVFYRTLDPDNSDTLGTQRVVFNGATAVAGIGTFVSLTVARSGYIYVAYDIDAGAERGLHRSTDAGVNWSANLSTTFVEATLDYAILYPASNTGDNNDCWCLYFDASADQLTLKMWDSSAGSATESAVIATVIDTGAADLTYQYPYSASVRHSDGHLIAAVITERDTATSDHRVFDINGTGSISELTAITTNIDDHWSPAVCIDQNSNDIYVAYCGKRDGSETLGTTNKCYYTKSTDDGSSWSAGDTTYMENAGGNVRHCWTAPSGPRFYVTWFQGTTAGFGNSPSSVAFSASQTVTPGAFSLTFTGAAPTVTATDHKVATPSAFSLTWTGAEPTVTVASGTVVTPDAFSLAFTGAAPTVSVSDNKLVTPGAFSLAWTGAAPAVTASDHKVVEPGAFSLSWAGAVPTVTVAESSNVVVTPDAFSLTWVGAQAVVTRTGPFKPGIGGGYIRS